MPWFSTVTIYGAKRATALAAAAFLGCATAPGSRVPPAAEPAPAGLQPTAAGSQAPATGLTGASARPAPWLVTIVVDQLAAWIADERWPLLPPDGGFARLRREGLTVREMRYAHAVTETAPGHGALYTGAPPHVNGIVANDLLGPDGKRVSFLADPDWALIPVGGGSTHRPGCSLRALRVETLADRLRAARPGALIFSFSLKDRGAVFAGGRRPDLALWLDTERGAFVTSTAFAPSSPSWSWAVPFGEPAVWTREAAQPWVPLDAAWLAAHTETPDDQPGEGDYLGLGVRFPHRATSAKVLRATPAGDRVLFALAIAAARQAAATRGDRPLLLALSLSANDYVAHVFGPNSWEAWDELRRLDASLAGLLLALDQLAGSGGYAVMLTGDHGANPLPEVARAGRAPWCRKPVSLAGAARSGCPGGTHDPDRWGRPCGRGRRVAESALVAALEAEARELLGDPPDNLATGGRWIAGLVDPFVYLSAAGRALRPEQRATLLRRLDVAARTHWDLARVVDVKATPATCPPPSDDSLEASICRSLRADQSADFYLVAAPGTFFDPELVPGAGTNHGSPYLYDRAVPLLVRAPGRVPAGQVIDGPIPFSAFARTAASLLDIPPPAALAVGAPDLASM